MKQHLLAPTASALQRHWLQSQELEKEFADATTQLRGFKANPHDRALLWLVWEYGLEAILPYSQDLRQTLQQGLEWQRLRGTPKSVLMAMSWLQFKHVQLENAAVGRHYYRYQLALGQLPTDEQVKHIHKLSGLSSPASAKLERLYHGLDVRAQVLSKNGFGQLLSDISGVDFVDKGKRLCKVSFARKSTASATFFETQITIGHQRHVVGQAEYLGCKRLSDYHLSDREPSKRPIAVGLTQIRPQYITMTQARWLGPWQGGGSMKATNTPRFFTVKSSTRNTINSNRSILQGQAMDVLTWATAI
ncbi:phage tail protein [Pseudoalteromonas xiamenensis]|uniref:phage tail protein n=1 Tax=Pseudoalteromonas xiamenensis TaxID=882626 RepID=UPI0027E54062|nr:phage tail protein [Pseudoalteromonas xiamenensis]WMN59277.1 phage tail protein [Pseudoalteromonas xiamenensis]